MYVDNYSKLYFIKKYGFILIFFIKRSVLCQDYNMIPNVSELFFQVNKALNQREFGANTLFSVLRKFVSKVVVF